MKKASLFITLLIIGFGSLFSQTDENKTSNFQLSLIPPLSTNGKHASQYTNNFSFNILIGVSQNENAFTLGGFANIITNNANGVQIAGLANYIGNNGNGILFAGLVNRSRDYNGMQFAGLMNASRDVKGLQFAGILNTAKDLKGFQFGGIGNISSDMKGFQFAGIGNIARDVNGFQFSGIFNKAKHVEGLQFAGILNIAEHSDYPIGLVNLIKDGEMGIGISYNEIGSTLLSFRSGGKVLYGIVGAGYNHKARNGAFTTEAGFGAHINISSKFRINNELRSSFITSFSDNEETYHESISIMPAYKIAPSFEIFGGPSINYMESDEADHKDLFPGNNIWRKFDSSKMKQVYFGFSVGTHFIF